MFNFLGQLFHRSNKQSRLPQTESEKLIRIAAETQKLAKKSSAESSLFRREFIDPKSDEDRYIRQMAQIYNRDTNSFRVYAVVWIKEDNLPRLVRCCQYSDFGERDYFLGIFPPSRSDLPVSEWRGIVQGVSIRCTPCNCAMYNAKDFPLLAIQADNDPEFLALRKSQSKCSGIHPGIHDLFNVDDYF